MFSAPDMEQYASAFFTDKDNGVSYYQAETEDNSGVICRIEDFYTGYNLKNVFGSSWETAYKFAKEWVESHNWKRFNN
jgi:hypothetical protein